MHDFGIQPVLLAAQVVNFLILLFILKKFLYGPILKVLETRKTRIAESLKQAEDIEKRLAEISEEEQKRILKAAQEGEKIIKEATDASVQIIEDGKKKYEEIVGKAAEDAKAQSEMEHVRLMQEVKANLAEVVGVALEKVTGKVLTEKDKKDILEKQVKNLS